MPISRPRFKTARTSIAKHLKARCAKTKPACAPSSKVKVSSVYDPDRKAFRDHVLAQYAASPLSADWPDGLVDAISAAE